jgi:hypothetical protein
MARWNSSDTLPLPRLPSLRWRAIFTSRSISDIWHNLSSSVYIPRPKGCGARLAGLFSIFETVLTAHNQKLETRNQKLLDILPDKVNLNINPRPFDIARDDRVVVGIRDNRYSHDIVF